MLLPSRRLLAAAAGLTAAGLAASAIPALLTAWTALALALAAAAAYDARRVLAVPAPRARRTVSGSLAVGIEREVELELQSDAPRALDIEVYDHHPGDFEARGMPRRVRVPPQGIVSLVYAVRPLARGAHRFGTIELRVATGLGLWRRALRAGGEVRVRVYPNFAALAGYALLATDHRLSRIGVLERQRRGEGLEFHQLREYREGDAQRQIDWKASARTLKLISREYQDERDQTVMLVLDCSRRMAAQDDALSHFDHALNAALLLAYASLRQGDAVGLMTMSGPERWLAPRKSAPAVDLVLNRVYDLQPSHLSPDYHAAAVELMRRVRKRSLVVILSNLRDEDEDTLAPALRLLQSRHLVLFASLREAILSRALVTRVESFDRALTHAAAAEYLGQRELAFRRMERAGAVCIDADPEQLPVALVNRYLQIKRERRL
jgi:uncharacterized protein (DUF58 family)